MAQKLPLLGLTFSELQSVVKNLGMPSFSAKQIASWLYDKKVFSIDEMTNLSLKHRELLKEQYEVGAEGPIDAMRSVDGTVKYLFRVVKTILLNLFISLMMTVLRCVCLHK